MRHGVLRGKHNDGEVSVFEVGRVDRGWKERRQFIQWFEIQSTFLSIV